MGEIITGAWAPVPGYGAEFEASRLGDVRRAKDGSPVGVTTRNGTPYITLRWARGATTATVARVILMAFTGQDPPRGTVAATKDGDKMNTRLENLEWRRQRYQKASIPRIDRRPWTRDPRQLCDLIHRLGGLPPYRDN